MSRWQRRRREPPAPATHLGALIIDEVVFQVHTITMEGGGFKVHAVADNLNATTFDCNGGITMFGADGQYIGSWPGGTDRRLVHADGSDYHVTPTVYVRDDGADRVAGPPTREQWGRG